MARYPVFKQDEQVRISRNILPTIHDDQVMRELEMFRFRGTIINRMTRTKGSAPLYTVIVGRYNYSIYANFLEKITK